MKKTALSLLLVPFVLAVLGPAAAAQACPGATGTLTVTPGTVTAGSPVSVEVCGLANGFAILAIAENSGSTMIGGVGPIPSAELCLEAPFIPFPIGAAGMDGCADRSFNVPMNVPLPGNLTLHLQGVLFGFTLNLPPNPNPGISFSLVTTNTATLTL